LNSRSLFLTMPIEKNSFFDRGRIHGGNHSED
jgi:hypothetical protein